MGPLCVSVIKVFFKVLNQYIIKFLPGYVSLSANVCIVFVLNMRAIRGMFGKLSPPLSSGKWRMCFWIGGGFCFHKKLEVMLV